MLASKLRYPNTPRRRRSCTSSSPWRQGRVVSTLSSASRVASSRNEPPQPRFWVPSSRSSNFWLLRKDEGQAEAVGEGGRWYCMGNYSRNDERGNGGERQGVCSDVRCPIRGILAAQRLVRPDGWSGHSSSAGIRHTQLGDPLNSPGRSEGLEYGQVRSERSVERSSSCCPRQSLGEVHKKLNVSDTTLEPISNKMCRGFPEMGRGRRCKRDHNSSLIGPVSVVVCALPNRVVAGDSAGDEPHVAAAL